MKIVAVNEATFEQVNTLGCLSCTYWHGSIEGDRCEARRTMFRAGHRRGKLALTDDSAVMGFIQYDPLASFGNFAQLRHGFDMGIPSDAWVIPCIITHKKDRRKGVSRALLNAVLDEATSEGRPLEAIGMEDAGVYAGGFHALDPHTGRMMASRVKLGPRYGPLPAKARRGVATTVELAFRRLLIRQVV